MTESMTLADGLALAFEHVKMGRLPDAERVYHDILAVYPQHPEANYNTGVLAVQIGRPELALPYFKAALRADPSQGSFRLSYIDALIQAGRSVAARRAIGEARQVGLGGPEMDALAVRANAGAPPAAPVTGVSDIATACERRSPANACPPTAGKRPNACRLILATCPLAKKWLPTLDCVNGHYPLGLASLHAVAEAAGHDVETLYLATEPEDRYVSTILERIRQKDAQVLGLSIITDNRVSSYRVIEAVQRETPDVRIIVGGVHATVMYEQMLTRYPQIVVVLGEGEATLIDLLQAIEAKRDLADVPGIAFWCEGKIVRTAERPQIADLDSLPFPRHDLFFRPDRIAAQLLTSRGCPFACSFCALDAVSRRKVRMRSSKSVVDEIEMVLTQQPQTKVFHIYDDQFFANNNRVIEICEEIVRRGINARFVCQGRVKPISRRMILALEKAGFVNVTLGLESGAPEVLKRCNKKILLKDVERALGMFVGTRIEVSVLLIIGLPGEDESTVQETMDFCQKLQKINYHVYDNRIQDLFVYPGTEICQNFKDAGKITDDFWLRDDDCPTFSTALDEIAFFLYRNKLLDALCVYRLFTADGFKAQRELIPSFLRFFYGPSAGSLRYRQNFESLITNAVADAIQNKRIDFRTLNNQIDSARSFTTLGIGRLVGDDASVLLTLETFHAGWQIPDIVSYAYRNRVGSLTEVIDKAVIDYLEEAFAADDGRLDEITPHDASELKMQASLLQACVAAHQKRIDSGHKRPDTQPEMQLI